MKNMPRSAPRLPKPEKPPLGVRSPATRLPVSNPRRTTVAVMPGTKGSGGGWLFAFVILIIGGAASFALYKRHVALEKVNETMEIITAEDIPDNTGKNVGNAVDENARLPDIKPMPEKDDERIFMKTSIENDSDFIFEDDESTRLPEKPPKIVPPATPEKEDPDEPGMVRKMETNRVPNKYKVPPERTLDLLVLYSPGVKERLGGPKKLLAHVNGLVNYTNKRFYNRKVVGRVRLVGLVEVEYTTAGTLDTDLSNLSGNRIKVGVRHVNTAASLRNKVGADMVTLFCGANLGAGGGLAFVPGAFSVMNCPVGAIFAHELQHNFGWNHQNNNDLSMIHGNFPGFAKWKPTVIPEGKIYVQYWVSKPKSIKVPGAGIEF